MTDNDLITAFTNELTIDRTSENIGATWLRKGAGAAVVESRTPFWFTGPENALRSQLCESLGKARERVFISSSSLSEPTVLQALSSAVQRGVRTYIFLDKVGFEEALTNTIASPLHGTALIRERESRGMDVALCDWHLPNKWGMVLSCPLDLTLSSSAGGWAMELDGEQIDEMQRHMTHEFWSTEGTREVLAAEEVSQPPEVAEPPFVLKPLLNGALVCRSRCSTEGHDAPSEDAFRAMKKWDRLSNGKSIQQSVVLKGQLVDITGKAGVSLYSTPEQCKPFSGAYAHSGASGRGRPGRRRLRQSGKRPDRRNPPRQPGYGRRPRGRCARRSGWRRRGWAASPRMAHCCSGTRRAAWTRPRPATACSRANTGHSASLI